MEEVQAKTQPPDFINKDYEEYLKWKQEMKNKEE